MLKLLVHPNPNLMHLHPQKHVTWPTKFEHIMNTMKVVYWPSTQFHHHKQSTKQLVIKFRISIIASTLTTSPIPLILKLVEGKYKSGTWLGNPPMR
jgi:hypothetical protein